MATSRGTLPPARPSTSRVLNEHSAARCHVFQGRKQKLLQDAPFSKVQKQSEACRLRSSMHFKFSAGRPESPVPTPATNTAGQTTLATRVTGKNSYFHYLERKLKLISSQVDSYQRELKKIMRVLRRKIDAYALRLNRLLESTRILSLGPDDEFERALQQLNAELVIFNKDLTKRINFMLAKIYSRDNEINRQTRLLHSKLAPFVQELDRQCNLLDLKIISYNQSLNKRTMVLKSRYCAFCVDFDSEFNSFNI